MRWGKLLLKISALVVAVPAPIAVGFVGIYFAGQAYGGGEGYAVAIGVALMLGALRLSALWRATRRQDYRLISRSRTRLPGKLEQEERRNEALEEMRLRGHEADEWRR